MYSFGSITKQRTIGSRISSITLGSGSWSGLLAPAGTPGAIIARLNAETHRGANTKEMREVMATQGGEVVWGTPEQFGKLIADEAVKWAKAVALSGAKTQ